MSLKYLDLCSGISAPTVAWKPLGFECVAYSEIEKFPSAVLAHHYDAPNLGDMSKFREWDEDLLAEVDLVVAGTPCQAFSIAGLRGGLEDERGNLTLIFVHLVEHIDAIRSVRGKPPIWILWENVPGVLSMSAFGCLLGGLAGEDDAVTIEKWPSSGVVDGPGRRVAWTVLDAQFFGVPQRRRRVFALAVPAPPAGHTGTWPDPAEIYALGQSLCRHTAPRRKTKQGTAADVAKSLRGNSGGIDREDMHTLIPDVAATLGCRTEGGGRTTDIDISGAFIPEVANPLTARMVKGINTTCDEGQTPIPVAFTHIADMSVRRLTPLECTRLQGFPDDYFDDVPGRSDSAVYKALGNSMAVPVMRWLGARIQQCLN